MIIVAVGGGGRGSVIAADTATYFLDTFTTGVNIILSSHAPDTGDSWTEQERTGTNFLRANATGFAIVQGNEASDRSVFTANPSPSTADYHVSADIDYNATPSDTDNPVFLLARFADNDNFYAAGIWIAAWSPSGVTLEIFKKDAGSPMAASLATTTMDLDLTTQFTMRFECEGTALRLKIDGVEKLSTTDGDHAAAGNAGLAIGNLRTATDDMDVAWRVDNFTVQALS